MIILKRLLVALLLITIVVVICFIECSNLNSITTNTKEHLQTISNYMTKGEKEKAEQAALKLEKDWKIYEDKLSFFESSDDINEIGLEISTLAPLIKSGSTEYACELRKIEVMLKHINSEDKYRIN